MGCALRAFYVGSGAQKGNVVLAYVQKSLAQELSRSVPPLQEPVDEIRRQPCLRVLFCTEVFKDVGQLFPVI